MLATFGRYLQCLSGTLSSTFLRDQIIRERDRRHARTHRRLKVSVTHPKRPATSLSFQWLLQWNPAIPSACCGMGGFGVRGTVRRAGLSGTGLRDRIESHRFLPLRILSGLQVHSGNTGNRRGAPVSVRHDVRGHIKDIGCVCAVSGHRGSSRTCGARRGCGISTKIHHPGENARAPQENRGGEQADWLIYQPRR
jgi:hypothetical protein